MSDRLRREPTALGHSRAIFGDQMLGQTAPGIEVSVIVLVTERPGALDALYLEYSPAIRATGLGFEFLFAVEPWNRHLTESLDDLIDSGEPIQILQASRTMGEASLLKEAAPLCRGETVLTIPAYHRVQADSLPGIIQAVERGADLAMARRWPRQDNWVNRMQNRVFHWLVAGVGKHKSHDTACGVRALRRDLLNDMPLYGDFFRFLPVLAAQDGYEVTEVACQQHPQDVKTRVYGPATYLRRLIDLLGLFFLARFTYKPLRFFGFFGTSLALPGGVILVVLLIMRLGGEPIGGRPMLLLGVLLLTLGVQAIALGLVGEMIVHLHTHAGRRYRTLEDEEDLTLSSERG